MMPRLTVLAVAAVIVVACGDDAAPTRPTPLAPIPDPALRVSGRTVDYRTGEAVAGVSIRWQGHHDGGAGQLAAVQSVSDASGRYEVVLPIADYFTFEIPGTGVLVRQFGFLRVPGKRLETDLLMNSGSCVARYGIVFDAVTRAPIAGAQVSRFSAAITDAEGRYRIDLGCEPRDHTHWGTGTTTISAQHPAYQFQWSIDGRREHTGSSGVGRRDFALMPVDATRQ